MKKFFIKLSAIACIVALFFATILFAIPIDRNAYLYEYNAKLKLIENTDAPRLIFIGASTLAFNLDSKMLSDSLGYNVINMGLHAGIGARYYINDYLQYVRKGDVVILSPSYLADFIDGSNGYPESLPDLMVATGWRNFSQLDFRQLLVLAEGIPFFCYRSLVRLVHSPQKGFDTPADNEEFKFLASGFNQYGDEVSHWHVPYKKGAVRETPQMPIDRKLADIHVDEHFPDYLKHAITAYEQQGATVILLPEISSETSFYNYNPLQIRKALQERGFDFAVNPETMVFSDSYGYGTWGDAHFERDGVKIASQKIISILKELIPIY